MAISIGTPQLATPTPLSNATLSVAGNTITSNSGANSESIGTTVTVNTNQQATPPVIQVSDDGSIESPFIDINRQNTENQSVTTSQPSDFGEVDTTPRQIREIDSEQQDIQTRSQILEEEEQAIEREISELQRKELELNRRRFELQRQSNIGQIINLQI